ncbi:Cytochrome C oxidase, cbb3-type, subunit III [Palleronia marisminoris]|uniref:Cytochrome c n=1 Tax=Palleronia marisminoris TaxID=315423 RepID=A0A1Y5RRM0_9RHOB|nr:c-type cytochrome [Palleronia marisminoris]SFG53344.1 Cytochrome C oxidase, cbb3-type, subunit III [Palleronia marisminoris]SLN23701.1 Cytochrome c [Palleronia marisminoris]
MNTNRAALATALLLLTTGCVAPTIGDDAATTPTGEQVYQTQCAACHGAEGRGDGPLAQRLDRRPADLTQLADGDAFPRAHIMGYVDGYFRDDAGQVMPQFGPEMAAGQLVPYDIGDGILTPTPAALIRVADYVESLQAE